MEEKEQIIKKIDELTSELNRQNLKIQTFTEIISHIRSRVMRAERRKKEIHNEIDDIKLRILAWEQAQSKNL